jgi:hypothetical protein
VLNADTILHQKEEAYRHYSCRSSVDGRLSVVTQLLYTSAVLFYIDVSLFFQNFCKDCKFRPTVNFLVFFSPANFCQQFLNRNAPNLVRKCLLPCDLFRWEWFLKSSKSKTRSHRKRNVKNLSNLHPRRHIFARCDETVKYFFLSIWCYLSDNVGPYWYLV